MVYYVNGFAFKRVFLTETKCIDKNLHLSIFGFIRDSLYSQREHSVDIAKIQIYIMIICKMLMRSEIQFIYHNNNLLKITNKLPKSCSFYDKPRSKDLAKFHSKVYILRRVGAYV